MKLRQMVVLPSGRLGLTAAVCRLACSSWAAGLNAHGKTSIGNLREL